MDAVIKGFEYGFGGAFGVFAACVIFSFIAGVIISHRGK